MSHSPWVSGTRAAAYFGPVSIQFWIRPKKCWNDIQLAWIGTAVVNKLKEDLQDKVHDVGGTWGVGTEITVEITEDGNYIWRAMATAAKLEPLFSDSIPEGDDW